MATITDLKALTEAVGGDLVEVEWLARGTQNPHDIEVRPSLMVKLRRADCSCATALELDPWVGAAVQGANNAADLPGAPGPRRRLARRPACSSADRARRPVDGRRPSRGNPHYTLDPGGAAITAEHPRRARAASRRSTARAFERTRQEFLAASTPRWRGGRRRWSRCKGAKVVAYHTDCIYFLTRFGLVQVGHDRGPARASRRRPRTSRASSADEGAEGQGGPRRALDDRKLADARGRGGGRAGAVRHRHAVGAVKGADTYIASMEHNVTALAEALR